MKHTVPVTVLDKKLYPELQRDYCADPAAGACPCYNIGDEFIFYRDDKRDDFWHMGLNTLVHTFGDANAVLLRGMGRHFPLYLRGASGRIHHERLDEARKRNDRLLFRRHAPRRFQN